MLRSLRRLTLLTLLVSVPGGAALIGPAWAQAPATPLSLKRFTAIDRLLKASGPLEAREITEAERRRFVRACRSLGSTDRLLRAKRAQCLAVIEASAADKILSTCDSYDECGSRLRPLRTAFDREITATRRLVVTVGREVEDRRCQAALRPPASDLRLLDAYDRGLTELQAAYSEGTELRVTLALQRLAEVPIDTLRSVRRQRADLRRDCR